jgi:hypothetical protein
MEYLGGSSAASAPDSSPHPYRSTWKSASKLGERGEAHTGSLIRDLNHGVPIHMGEFTEGSDGEFYLDIEVGAGFDVDYAERTDNYRPTELSGFSTSAEQWLVGWRGRSFTAVPREVVLELAYGHLKAEGAEGSTVPDHERRGYMVTGEDGPVQMVSLSQRELLTAAGTDVPEPRAGMAEWIEPFKPENQDVPTSDFDLSLPVRPAELDESAASVMLRELAAPSGGDKVMLEVKADDKWGDSATQKGTGNYFSETKREVWQGHGQLEDTGIFVSKAPWYTVVFGKSILGAPTEDLKALTLQKGAYRRGGDGKRSRGAVIPISELQAVSAGTLPTSIQAHLWGDPSEVDTTPEFVDGSDVWHEDFRGVSDADLEALFA